MRRLLRAQRASLSMATAAALTPSRRRVVRLRDISLVKVGVFVWARGMRVLET